MKTTELSAFAGVRNDVSPERFSVQNSYTKVRTDLQKGINVELDETGKPYRRLGTTVLNATPSHSLWAFENNAFVVQAGTLRRINPDLTLTDLGIPIMGNKVSYRAMGNEVFFSDRFICGVVGLGGYRQWGVTPPPRPMLSVTAGDLRPGTYLYTITYLRRDGHESGACPVESVYLATAGTLNITLPVSLNPEVNRVRVYVSDVNGEVPYLIATELNVGGTCAVGQLPAERSLALRTARCGPPPTGQVVGYYKGRMYVADGAYLWYSLPYQYELFHKAVNFLPFTSPIKTFATVLDGIYIGTENETMFLSGDNPDEFERKVVAPYGTLLGTEEEVPAYYFEDGSAPEPVQLWMSKQGLCVGQAGGNFKNLTGDRYVLPDGEATGASLLKIRGASPQFVTTIFP